MSEFIIGGLKELALRFSKKKPEAISPVVSSVEPPPKAETETTKTVVDKNSLVEKATKCFEEAYLENPNAPPIKILQSAIDKFPPDLAEIKKDFLVVLKHMDPNTPASEAGMEEMLGSMQNISMMGLIPQNEITKVEKAVVVAAERMAEEDKQIAENKRLHKYVYLDSLIRNTSPIDQESIKDSTPEVKEQAKTFATNLEEVQNEIVQMEADLADASNSSDPSKLKKIEEKRRDLYSAINHIVETARKGLGEKGKAAVQMIETNAQQLQQRLIEPLINPQSKLVGMRANYTPLSAEWIPAESDDIKFDKFRKLIDREYTEPGNLGRHIFVSDQELVKYLKNAKNYKARDYLFHKIIDKVVVQRNSASRELYGMYEQADMTSFMRLVRQVYEWDELTPIAAPTIINANPMYVSKGEQPRRLGDVLAENYEVQLDALFQSHDADFYAAHALGEVRSFTTAAALYKSEYGEIAAKDPTINAAMHAYEMALLQIRDNNNGFIPPGAIGYDPNNMTYYWDHLAEDIFNEMIKNGTVLQAKRDDKSGLKEVVNNRLIIDKANPLKYGDLDPLEVKRILKLAKGFGIVSLRLLDIFAQSRGPGSNHPQFGMDGFASIPYEGLAKIMNPMAHSYTKWKWGGEMYNPFFQQVFDPDNKMNWKDPGDVEKIYRAVVDGNLGELLGDEAQRIMDMDNLNNMSGVFGPWTKWRVGDASKGWSDKDKEWLGGGIRLSFSQNWAKEWTTEYLKTKGYDPKRLSNPQGFNRFMEEKFHNGDYQKYMENHETHGALAQRLETAYKAHVWLQMVERNPLLVARNLVMTTKEGKPDIRGEPGDFMKIKNTLRHNIINEILGINLLGGEFTGNKTPNDSARNKMRDVAVLEGDVASVRELLLDDQRSVKETDFNTIDTGMAATEAEILARMPASNAAEIAARDEALRKNRLRKQNAKRYWEIVHKTVTGKDIIWKDTTHHTSEMMHHIGVYIPDSQTKLHIDWDKIGPPGKHLHLHGDHVENLERLTELKSNYLLASDDVVWSKFDLLNLGARNLVRRAGDLEAHANGIAAQGDYIGKVLKGKANQDDLIKQLVAMRDGFAGDDLAISWKTGYIWAQATSRLFEAKIFGSRKLADSFFGKIFMLFQDASVMEKTYGKFYANNWTSNERRQWAGKLISERIIPPKYLDAFGNRYDYNAHRFEKETHCTDSDVLWEVLMMGIPIAALAISLYGIAKGTEEAAEGGGGGGGGGGGHH